MQAFVRRYRIGAGSVTELVARVEDQFVGRPSGLPDGIAGFHAIDPGDGTIATIALFEPAQDRAQVESRVRALQTALAEFELEELDALTGEVVLVHAGDRLLESLR